MNVTSNMYLNEVVEGPKFLLFMVSYFFIYRKVKVLFFFKSEMPGFFFFLLGYNTMCHTRTLENHFLFPPHLKGNSSLHPFLCKIKDLSTLWERLV